MVFTPRFFVLRLAYRNAIPPEELAIPAMIIRMMVDTGMGWFVYEFGAVWLGKMVRPMRRLIAVVGMLVATDTARTCASSVRLFSVVVGWFCSVSVLWCRALPSLNLYASQDCVIALAAASRRPHRRFRPLFGDVMWSDWDSVTKAIPVRAVVISAQSWAAMFL